MRRTTTVTTLAAICAAMAIAPSLAAAEKKQYEGPIDLAKNPGFVTASDGSMVGPFRSYTPTIQLKVIFDGKTPTDVLVKAFGLYGPCSGRGVSDGETKYDSGGGITVRKNGRFSFDDYEQGFITVSGRIPAKGAATGTVRAVTELSFQPASDGYDPTYGTCDSGVISWKATRTGRLSTTDDL